MTSSRHLNLAPPLVQSGRVDELIQLGQTLTSSLSPSDNSLAIFVTNTVRQLLLKVSVYLHLTIIPSRRLELKNQITRKSNRCTSLALMLCHHRKGVW
jgi:hypothetical protein